MLTREQWIETKAPFCYVRLDNKAWTQVQKEIVIKWIESHCGGWFYWDEGDTYVFEKSGDRILFVLWVKSDPFDQDMGDVDLG